DVQNPCAINGVCRRIKDLTLTRDELAVGKTAGVVFRALERLRAPGRTRRHHEGGDCCDDISQDIFSVFHNMIFFLCLGLWSSLRVTQTRRPFPVSSRNFALRCKESDWTKALCFAVPMHQPNEGHGDSSLGYFGASKATVFLKRASRFAEQLCAIPLI